MEEESNPTSHHHDNRRHLIVEGSDALRGRFPYFTTLDRNCGGALIAPDIVLTAGHCKPASLKALGQLHVGTYAYDYQTDQEDDSSADYNQETFGLTDMVRHPQFQCRGEDEFVHDFTLLKLDGRSTQPVVRINRDNNLPAPRQEVVAMGLGYLYNVWASNDDNNDDKTTDNNSQKRPLRPQVLQQVALNYLLNEVCRLAADQEESYSIPKDRIGPTHLCTYAPPDNARDACAYDSGGPIIIPGSSRNNDYDTNDKDTLVALVSWGVGCANPVFPGVNARVAAVSDWIDDVVCRLSDDPPDDFPCHVASGGGGGDGGATRRHAAEAIVSSVMLLVAGLVMFFCRQQYRRGRRAGPRHYQFVQQDEQRDKLDPDDSKMSPPSSPWGFNFFSLQRRHTGETASLYQGSSSDSNQDLVASYNSIGVKHSPSSTLGSSNVP